VDRLRKLSTCNRIYHLCLHERLPGSSMTFMAARANASRDCQNLRPPLYLPPVCSPAQTLPQTPPPKSPRGLRANADRLREQRRAEQLVSGFGATPGAQLKYGGAGTITAPSRCQTPLTFAFVLGLMQCCPYIEKERRCSDTLAPVGGFENGCEPPPPGQLLLIPPPCAGAAYRPPSALPFSAHQSELVEQRTPRSPDSVRTAP
jgi:hypothetical protein